jgi:hypothetical protein
MGGFVLAFVAESVAFRYPYCWRVSVDEMDLASEVAPVQNSDIFLSPAHHRAGFFLGQDTVVVNRLTVLLNANDAGLGEDENAPFVPKTELNVILFHIHCELSFLLKTVWVTC